MAPKVKHVNTFSFLKILIKTSPYFIKLVYGIIL